MNDNISRVRNSKIHKHIAPKSLTGRHSMFSYDTAKNESYIELLMLFCGKRLDIGPK